MKMITYSIEDAWHCEGCGEYESFELALAEIRRRATLPWNEDPNLAPCTSWRTCGRRYTIRLYGADVEDTPIVEITSAGVQWEPEFAPIALSSSET